MQVLVEATSIKYCHCSSPTVCLSVCLLQLYLYVYWCLFSFFFLFVWTETIFAQSVFFFFALVTWPCVSALLELFARTHTVHTLFAHLLTYRWLVQFSVFFFCYFSVNLIVVFIVVGSFNFCNNFSFSLLGENIYYFMYWLTKKR